MLNPRSTVANLLIMCAETPENTCDLREFNAEWDNNGKCVAKPENCNNRNMSEVAALRSWAEPFASCFFYKHDDDWMYKI